MSKIKESFIMKCLRCDVQFVSKSKVIRLCGECKKSIGREETIGNGLPLKGIRNSSKTY